LVKKPIKLAFFFPGGKSFGEGIVLYGFSRELPKNKFDVRFFQCFDNGEKSIRKQFKMIFKERLLPIYVAKSSNGKTALRLHKKAVHSLNQDPPDLIILSSYAYFLSKDQGYSLITRPMIEPFQRNGVPIAVLDVAGNLFDGTLPKGWKMMSPRPLTWKGAKKSHLIYRLSPKERQKKKPSGKPRVLWSRSTYWWSKEYLFAETQVFKTLSLFEDQIEIWVNSISDDEKIPFIKSVKILPRNSGYERYQKSLAKLSLFITPNSDSVAASRAATLGVPIVLVEPQKVVRNSKLFHRNSDQTPPEFNVWKLSSMKRNIKTFKQMITDLNLLRERLHYHLEKNSTLPIPEELVNGLLKTA